jgi:hypothetical protein
MEQGTVNDLSSFSQVFKYASPAASYRSSSVRINSGVAPGGINRVEYFGINGTYVPAAIDQTGFAKSLGFSFQQTLSGTVGPYLTLLDIDYSGITVNTGVPLKSNIIRPASGIDVTIQGNTATIGDTTTLSISNNTISSTTLQIIPFGSTNTVFIRSALGATSVVHQAFIASVATDVATINTSGLSLNYTKIGTAGQASLGGLQTSGTNLQYHNGTGFVDIMSTGSNLRTNLITTNSGQVMTIRGSTATTTAVADYIFSNCTTDNTGYYISPVGSNNSTYIKASNQTGKVIQQVWVGSDPVDAITYDNSVITANYFRVGTTGPSYSGGLQMSGTSLQYHDGTAYQTLLSAGANFRANTITINTGTTLAFRGTNGTTNADANYTFSNCTTDNIGYSISTLGSLGTTYLKSMNATAPVYHQSWIGGTPTNTIIMDGNGVFVDYLRVGSNSPSSLGSLRRESASNRLQFHDGVRFYPVNLATAAWGYVTCGILFGTPNHNLLSFSPGVTIGNLTDPNIFTLYYPALPAGYAYITSVSIRYFGFGTQQNTRFNIVDNVAGFYVSINPTLDGSNVTWASITGAQILMNVIGTPYRISA